MRIIKINGSDNVAVALNDIPAGCEVCCGGEEIVARQFIPSGHKVALRHIKAGESVVKYGYPIGVAAGNIAPGEWVHTHNVKTTLEGTLTYAYEPALTPVTRRESTYFKGFRRKDGRAGIRNGLWIVPMVGCVNGIANIIAKCSAHLVKGTIDGVHVFGHPYGCSQLGDDLLNTQKALAGLVRHPNAGGVLVLALGCESNILDKFKEVLGEWDSERVKFLVSQDVSDEVGEGVAQMEALAGYAGGFVREDIPMGDLVVGLKCGGSDGLSGITANPLVGAFSDMLIAEGGTTILTEVPEMFGAETILMNRCKDRATFDKTVSMINGFKEYFIENKQPVYENPSPGNREGGITTLEEKSLGCTQKGGSATVTDVLEYAQPVVEKGLNLLTSPGNDLVAATALAFSGAHIVLFTTGRGTPFGAPAPTVKISTNTTLAEKKREWIDFDAGKMLEGTPFNELAEDLYEYVRRLASGGLSSKTELNGIMDMAIFKTGVTA